VSTQLRASGPWDETEFAWDETERLDLGSLLITAIPGIDVQVQVDESTGAVALVTLATADSGVQLQVFAAPKSGGLWDEARPQIIASINESSGLVEENVGAFGPEIWAQIPNELGMQVVRFVGIEGPRWFLRAAFVGEAARPSDAAVFMENAVRGLIIVRGNEALPVGTPLVLTLPVMEEEPVPEAAVLLPPERGPEITEIR
jgi:hypothetical protein